MSDIPSFPYAYLWQERSCAPSRTSPAPTRTSSSRWPRRCPWVTRVHRYPLEAANDALADLRAGRFTGAAVVVPDQA